MLENELRIGLELAGSASRKILEHYSADIIAEEKLGADNFYEPVTAADRDASRIIVDGLRSEFPDDAVLSEEDIDPDGGWAIAERAWIIDPIDGTAGFIKRDGDFAVQIGLASGGVPLVGIVHLPFHRSTYFAVKGQGAFFRRDDLTARLTVSEARDFSEMDIAVTRNHYSDKMAAIIEHFGFRSTVRRGSVGLKIGLIASQECDIYINPGPRTKLWDTCGPQIILEEAGGKLTDLFGDPIKYDDPDVRNLNGLLAANAASHESAVERLGPILKTLGRKPSAKMA